MLASFDPLALDQACFDMVRNAPAVPGSMADPHGEKTLEGKDKFTCVHPRTDGEFGLAHAEKLKIGSRTYTLTEV
jgi:uncharacterized Fe-S center protein